MGKIGSLSKFLVEGNLVVLDEGDSKDSYLRQDDRQSIRTSMRITKREERGERGRGRERRRSRGDLVSERMLKKNM